MPAVVIILRFHFSLPLVRNATSWIFHHLQVVFKSIFRFGNIKNIAAKFTFPSCRLFAIFILSLKLGYSGQHPNKKFVLICSTWTKYSLTSSSPTVLHTLLALAHLGKLVFLKQTQFLRFLSDQFGELQKLLDPEIILGWWPSTRTRKQTHNHHLNPLPLLGSCL